MALKRHPVHRFSIALSIVSVLALLSSLIVPTISLPVVANAQTGSNAITLENQKPGTRGWQFDKPATQGEIQGYADQDSVLPGQTVNLYVSTKASENYRVNVYRFGYYQDNWARLVTSFAPSAAAPAQGYYYVPSSGTPPSTPANCPSCRTNYTPSASSDPKQQPWYIVDANWRSTASFTVPSDWLSGIYMFKLIDSNGYEWGIPLVVRSDASHSDVLFNDPDYTDQAYNYWGGTSLYSNYQVGNNARAYAVSFNRPYLYNYGLGNLLFGTMQMDSFLEQHGYDVTYTTDAAISAGSTNLENHRVFLVPFHNEYYTYTERKTVEHAIVDSVDMAYFSANNMYWQVRAVGDFQGRHGRILVCYKPEQANNGVYPVDPYSNMGAANAPYVTSLWRDNPYSTPEDDYLKQMWGDYGSNYQGGYQNLIVGTTTGANSWIFNGSGFSTGQSVQGVLGQEIDFPHNDGSINSYDHVSVVAQSPFVNENHGNSTAYALLDQVNNGPMIFDAGTLHWALALTNYSYFGSHNPVPESRGLEQVTSNLLDKMVATSTQHQNAFTYYLSLGGSSNKAAANSDTPNYSSHDASVNSEAVVPPAATNTSARTPGPSNSTQGAQQTAGEDGQMATNPVALSLQSKSIASSPSAPLADAAAYFSTSLVGEKWVVLPLVMLVLVSGLVVIAWEVRFKKQMAVATVTTADGTMVQVGSGGPAPGPAHRILSSLFRSSRR